MERFRGHYHLYAYFVLLLAILACSISGEDPETISEETSLNDPVQLATVAITPAPTWTPIPTFTAISLLNPTATQDDVVQLPTATQEAVEQPPTPTEEFAPPEPIGDEIRIDSNPLDGAPIVYVPAGEFMMGSDAYGASPDEKPAHEVYLDAFWLYQTTVTNSLYRQCIAGGACEGSMGRFPDNRLPAVNVTWFDATAYCQWAGGQLPTEAQWEKGARGTDGRLFPWGDDLPTCDLANYKNCYGSKEIEVENLAAGASPYGALHMVGNVWEWVWDWYDPGYYLVSPDSNPTGPVEVEEEFRVQRGGSFENDPSMLYASIRSRSGPTKADYRKGFRCVIVE